MRAWRKGIRPRRVDGLMHVAARVVSTARRLHLRLPAAWPWAAAFTTLFQATCGPPPAPST